MAKRIVEGIKIESSSGNFFADLGVPDAENLRNKSGLVIEITRAVRRLGLAQEEAGRRIGLAQPKVSAMLVRQLRQCVRAQADGLPEPAGV
ncbi:MAG: helix-turn-helix domain-containing protein [Nitrococcus sp.]|nr:helix-turn-helix domain-containing protein [Nitrococcus sp.]